MEQKMKKKERGITLIALAVTIIVLLILAGITIQVVLQGGILGQAEKASDAYKIADLRDRIDVIRMAYIADKAVDASLPITDLWDRLVRAKIIASVEDVEDPYKDSYGNDVYNLNTKDGYTVEIIVNDKGFPEIGDIAKGNLPPVIRRFETSATKTSITAKAIVSRLKTGTVEYWYKLSTADDSTYTKIENVTADGVTVSTGITEGSTYTVKAVATNELGTSEPLTVDILAKDPILVTELEISSVRARIATTHTKWLTTTVKPDDAENKTVEWSSSNTEVATVDNNGVITAKKAGTATITVKTKDGSNLSKTCEVTVDDAVEVGTLTSIQNDGNKVAKDMNGNLITIPNGFKVLPNGTSDTNIEAITYNFDSTNHTPCVQDGIVIADSEGNQFVWVPVDAVSTGTTEPADDIRLGRYTFKRVQNSSTGKYEDGTPTLVQDAANYETTTNLRPSRDSYYSYDFQELETSSTNTPAKNLGNFVTKTKLAGGYYLARYEASQGSDGKVKSQYDKAPWASITQPTAATKAQGMYSSSYIESDLVNSYSWDTAIVFIQKYSGNTNYANKISVNTSGVINTGKAGDRVCNIHDMASNCYEWSTERYTSSTYPGVVRGGQVRF